MKETAIPKYQAVHDEILTRLMAGHYSIGTRLPTEDLLSKAFDVSRVTVRKALEMLVRAGYLTAKQGSGYVVATLSPPSLDLHGVFHRSGLERGPFARREIAWGRESDTHDLRACEGIVR